MYVQKKICDENKITRIQKQNKTLMLKLNFFLLFKVKIYGSDNPIAFIKIYLL